MTMTHEQMKALANLARIDVSDSEIETFSKDFDSILGYVEQINQVDISEIETRHLQTNVARADGDANESGAFSPKMLAEAPGAQDGFYKVPKIL